MGGVVHSSFWATGVVIPLLTPFPVACNREDRDWYRVGEWVFISHTTTLGITRRRYDWIATRRLTFGFGGRCWVFLQFIIIIKALHLARRGRSLIGSAWLAT